MCSLWLCDPVRTKLVDSVQLASVISNLPTLCNNFDGFQSTAELYRN